LLSADAQGFAMVGHARLETLSHGALIVSGLIAALLVLI